jgi:hypothetical protein
MKKLVLSFVAVLFAAMAIVSCGGSKSDPKAVATSFLNARNSMDYEGAKKFGTPETAKMIDMMASFSSMVPDSMKNESKKIKIEIKDVKEEGDNATVTYSESLKPGDQTLKMVKKDGKWLVNMSKEDMGAGAGAAGEEGAMAPTEEAVPAKDTATVKMK